MRRLVASLLVLVLGCSVLVAQVPVPPDGLYITTADTLQAVARSNWQTNTIASITSGSPLASSPITGIGEIKVGQTVTGTGIPGGTTVAAVSAQVTQIPAFGGTMTSVTHTNTTLDGISALWCPYIKATMMITKADVPANTYAVTDCSSGSLTMSAAASGGTTTTTTFTPAFRLSANATATATFAALTINANTVQLTIAADILKTGSLEPTKITPWTMTVNTDRSTNTDDDGAFTTAGYLRNIVVRATAGSPVPGSTHVRLELVRGGTVQYIITEGPVTASEPWTWPGRPSRPLSETCRIVTKAFARPNAGENVEIPIPAGVWWKWISMANIFQSSTTPGDRIPAFAWAAREGLQGHRAVMRATFQQGFENALYQAAITSANPFVTDFGSYVTYPSGPLSGGFFTVGIPEVKLLGGSGAVFRLIVGGIQAADQWLETQGVFEECLAGTEATP